MISSNSEAANSKTAWSLSWVGPSVKQVISFQPVEGLPTLVVVTQPETWNPAARKAALAFSSVARSAW
jgi:hypothetical protein